MIIRSAALNTRGESTALAVTREPDQKTSQLTIRSMMVWSDVLAYDWGRDDSPDYVSRFHGRRRGHDLYWSPAHS